MEEKIKPKRLSLEKKHNLVGWAFLLPAAILIFWMSFYPMIRALLLSFETGIGNNMKWTGFSNYQRLFSDKQFWNTLGNTFIYLIIQVPIMLLLGLMLATMLNNKDLRCKGLFRTAIFLPCATALVSYSMIFRTLFAADGLINSVLVSLGIFETGYNWLANPATARMVLILALIWRWTGYNMVFYLAALQNVDYSIYEAARIDGASPFKQFTKITIPMLKPTILLTSIVSINGTLQLFDESKVLTNGGPANSTMTVSHYLYNLSFQNNPKFGYAAAMSFVILVIIAVLAFVQMKVGDER